MEICSKCESEDIRQQITFMFDPNDPPATFDLNNGTCDDFYYCVECEEECFVDEVKKDN